ncbi:uncharacterized protein LOC8284196 isoform X2 [Ricinus communis]|uniref:uncharacterized protein LOC8284196 isoform X2 n=1 Tax=Ricinus communis TaxID=3988 RepID=UPI0007723FB1|nr:uncharacterized protein LOC8284196 isoform X2 [Ricinus communis]|eukprot:XP_015574278.1 uncharacterized protein LOC8284196 isoform X2 [Ricinus communis]
MSYLMNEQSSDQQQNVNSCFDDESSSKHEDDEEDEDEDVDFNPFLKGTPSPEASSSLSSEVEELDGNSSKTITAEVQNYDVGDSEHGEMVVMQNAHAFCAESEKQSQVLKKSKKRKSDSVSQSGNESIRENVDENDCLDDEDAIWKRTRARYSLASFTLDELETFLQETDDEDDLQNVDDEEEYRKFLAAVLQGGDGDGQSTRDNETVDDEDEDNDADFEIELEELLESDIDDSKRDVDRKVEYDTGGRRPETRQNKRQKASAQYKKKLLEQTKRPLRPLLPILPNGPIASVPIADGRALTHETAPSYIFSTAEHGLINGFTPQQIGQLHCLIYEHVQLLIQVFSLCVLDPSRQQIASQVQGLISEMLHKRDEVITSRSVPYPGICFHPLYMCPSVMDEFPNLSPQQCIESSSAPNMQILITQDIPTTTGRNNNDSSGRINASQTAGSFWVPFMSGPLISILDVAPLNLVERYMDDVFNAVREYRQRHLDSSCDAWNEREPLFQLPRFPSVAEANGEVSKGNTPPAVSSVPSTPGQQPPKKTLAASIVENVKKQSVALVPKDISKLAQRFLQLFNPALFPHKPPPAAVSNRILFTDSEDELLALGMMEYNTDWKAIQQRFLPCKSKHQIFVRQKNRCSSKAPENPIKAVRRMKTSPLTAEEIESIQEGLRVLKHDWMSVCRFIVPHRDPSLLPRQWRIALGTQRSYKLDAAKKEKRRIYESNRRRCKTADLANWQQDNQVDSTGGENNSGDDYVDNPNEAYVHQAFLADWRPDASNLISSEHPCLNLRDKNFLTGALPREGTRIKNQSHIDNMHGFPYARYSVHLNHQVSDTSQGAAKSQFYLWPYWTRRTDGAHLVKLAPDLPPVNLPPTVRVISQTAFKSNQCAVPIKVPALGGTSGDARKENIVPQPAVVANLRSTSLAMTKRDKRNQVGDKITTSCPEEFTSSHPEESAILHDTCAAEERGTESDLQMHPLLFQSPEDGRLSYYPLSCSTGASSSFTFFSANQPQLNLSLFHSSRPANHTVDCFNKSSKTGESTSASCGIDFHPLLQRAEEENIDFATSCSIAHQYVCLGGKSAQPQNPLGAVQTKSPVNSGPSTTGSKPPSSIEKANELDLEIHLSSMSAVEKTRGSRDVGASNQLEPSTSAPNSGNTIDKDKSKSSCHQCCENRPAVSSNLVSGADAIAVQSNNDARCDMEDKGDQAPPEIVMEQEELSDSDEETEEHVEFECEEMADSDGEEVLGCEPIAEVQDKEFPSIAMEEVTTDADYGNKQCEWSSPVHPTGNTSTPRKGSTFLKLNLKSLGRDATNSSWLTLDSCASVDPPSRKAKHEECILGVCPVVKNLASGRSNRSCKKLTSTKSGATEKDVVDMAQQLSLGLLAVSTLKKPRKRASRTNTGLSTGRINETSSYDQDKIG